MCSPAGWRRRRRRGGDRELQLVRRFRRSRSTPFRSRSATTRRRIGGFRFRLTWPRVPPVWRGVRSVRPAISLSIHQLHELRSAVHDRARRARTTVRPRRWRRSRMCADCRREYDDVRRTGAFTRSRTPVRSAVPRLTARSSTRRARRNRRSDRCAAARASGRGSDRRDQGARRIPPGVRCNRIRRRCSGCGHAKRRDEKPFAVMVRDLADAESLAALD